MIFGIPEIREFAKNHEDPRVRIMLKRLNESISKNARWCEEVNRLNEQIKELKAHFNENKTLTQEGDTN